MTAPGAIDEVTRRIEANLRAPRKLATPIGTIELGGHVYVRRNAGEAALTATLDARKGLLLKRATQVTLDVVAAGASESEGSLDGLRALVAAREQRLRNRLDSHLVLVAFSPGPAQFGAGLSVGRTNAPGGWTDEARAYAANDPPGSGYAHAAVHLVLIGPAPTDVVTGAHDELARSLGPVLRGRTDDEEDALARDRIEHALALSKYAVLDRVARGEGGDALDPTSVERAARALASADASLRMETVRGAGTVLRRKT